MDKKKALTSVLVSSSEIDNAKMNIRQAFGVFERKRILVIGDLGLDEYLIGDVRRISPEAPVPVVEVKSQEYRVGLAANVAQNIQSLGGMGQIIGLVGVDEAANELAKLLKSNGVSDQHLVADSKRPTTRKVRVMSGQHHLVRVDFETKSYLDEHLQNKLYDQAVQIISGASGLIIQDYGKGVFSENFCQKIIDLAKKNNCRVVVDPHRTTPVRYYRGADLIKPNRDEAFILSGLNIDDLHLAADSIDRVAQAIQEQTHCPYLIITEGSKGVSLYEPNRVVRIPTVPRQVFDVTGAGDTYLVAFSLAWFSGLDVVTSGVMANFAAGVVVGKIGSVPCTKDELMQAMSEAN